MNNDRRQIIGLMAFAVAFALIGHTTKAGAGQAKAGADVKILLGGGLGAVLLLLLAEAGESGAQFAKGLAVLTLVSSVLINGTPVFNAVTKLTSKSSPALSLTTAPKVG